MVQRIDFRTPYDVIMIYTNFKQSTPFAVDNSEMAVIGLSLKWRQPCICPLIDHGHRVITHRDVTDVPTFFVRMLGKLLEFTGIEYAIQGAGSPFKLAEHAQLIIFCQTA